MNSDNPPLVLFAICATPVALSLVVMSIRCWLRGDSEETRERFSIFTVGILATFVFVLLQFSAGAAMYVLEPLHQSPPDSLCYICGGMLWQAFAFLWLAATFVTAAAYVVCMCWCSLGSDDAVCGMAI